MKKNFLLICLAASLLFAGCGSSNDFNQISGQQGGNINIPIAPIARDDAYTTNANTQLVVNAANGVLANDSQVNSVITYPAATTQNGTLVGAQDGSFTYSPAANFTGVDTFVYTLTNGFGNSSATVTITVAAVNGFFVDATNGSDTTGSFTNGLPFQTIQAAVTAAGTGATIVVRPGNYTGAVNLLNNQRLVGAGSALVNPQGAVRPTLTGPVVLADGNTVDFLRIVNSPGDAIDGSAGKDTTVSNCEIVNPVLSGVNLRSTSGTLFVVDNTIDGAAGLGITVAVTDDQELVAHINGNRVTNCSFDALGILATETLRAEIKNNIFTGNQENFTFECITGLNASSCLDVENNQNDDFWRFANLESTATNAVEELDIFETINTGTLNVLSGFGFFPVTRVDDGACGF